jgi:tRNA dimethylallyltransferase
MSTRPQSPSRQKILNRNNQTLPKPVGPIYLVGPTGVGKSSLACDLAQALGAEIIGADAFQVYSGLDILTAQPSAELRHRVKHHLVGCTPATEAFDVAEYHRIASAAVKDIQSRGRIPLVVGGTGLYVRALIAGLSPTPPADPALRETLLKCTLPELIERLRAADPDAPGIVDLQNRRRVERAIEICETSRLPLAHFRGRTTPAAQGILLLRDRDDLHGRIASHVDSMFANGVIDEVRRVADAGVTASRAIGFREIRALLAGEISEAECRDRMCIATRQYSKRQLTWFRHQSNFLSLNVTSISSPEAVLQAAMQLLDFA